MAGFLSYGAGKALSYQHDFGKDIDRLYQREAYRAQVEAEKERKASFYASMMKEQTAATPLNQQKLSMFYEGVAKEVADFAMNNPGWESDVMKSQKMYSIMDKYINNDIIREDQQVQQEWEKTKQAVNQGQITQSEYNTLAEQYENYKENGGDPYVFLNPKRQTVNEIIEETSKILKADQRTETDQRTGKISRISEVSDENYDLTTTAILADPDKKIVFEREYNAIDEKFRTGMYSTLFDYTLARIKAAKEESTEDIGYDQKYLINYKEGLDRQTAVQSARPSTFQTNVRLPLAEGRTVPAHPANYTLTPWAREGGEINMSGQGKIFKTYDKDGVPVDVNFKGTMRAMDGGPELFTKGGITYAKVPVIYTFNPSLETDEIVDKPTDTQQEKLSKKERRERAARAADINYKAMSDKLKELGWEEYSLPAESNVNPLSGNVSKSATFKGTVIVQADVSGASRMAYDTKFGMGDKELVQNQLSYNDNYALYEAAEQGDLVTISSLIGGNIGRRAIQSKGAQMGIDLSEAQWEPFDKSEDPSHNFYRAIVTDKNGKEKHLIYDNSKRTVIDFDPPK